MTKKLGFGLMRLPLLDKNDQTSFDMQTIEKMVDTFLERGFTYFDTAYVYHSHKSEIAFREAVAKRHSRNSFTIATKIPPRILESVQDQENIFNEQLEKLGVDYMDYFLIHNITVSSYKQAQQFDSFAFASRMKAEGKAKHIGMSFHDSPELLDEVLTAHPELDFVQLQINYIDWDNPGIRSRECYEVAVKHKKPVVVMEPVKGGNLASLPAKAEELLKAYNPEASIPSWAVRFAASLEGVIMVLSGMSTYDQLLDNTSYMEDFKPLTDEEREVLAKAVEIINATTVIPCTTCRYCVEGCPQNIPIPDFFALYNDAKRAVIAGPMVPNGLYYQSLVENHGRAKDCIDCRQCESACPQHLDIPAYLKDVSDLYDNAPPMPGRR